MADIFKNISNKLNNNPSGMFLVKALVSLSIILLIDFLAGSAIRYFYFRQSSGPEYVTTSSVDKTTADIVIFGSSRANHHYHPEVFEKRFNMSCHNAGRDGFDMFYHYAVLNSILTRYRPKKILLDFNNEEFIYSRGSYEKISALLPYYKDHPEIRPVVRYKSGLEKIKLLSRVYPYNSTLAYVILGNTGYNKMRRGEINGYVPMFKTWARPPESYPQAREYKMDTVKINLFEDFVKACADSGIDLTVIFSPYYAHFSFVDKSIAKGKEIAGKYNVPFYDFSNDTLFLNNRQLFANSSHLNDKGARLFSDILIDSLLVTGRRCEGD